MYVSTIQLMYDQCSVGIYGINFTQTIHRWNKQCRERERMRISNSNYKIDAINDVSTFRFTHHHSNEFAGKIEFSIIDFGLLLIGTKQQHGFYKWLESVNMKSDVCMEKEWINYL